MTQAGSFSFSLSSLFRLVTLLCLGLGWLALLRFARPEVAMFVVLAIVGVMAFVVGLRRHAPPARRILAAGWFFGLGVFVAFYSALWAWVIQLPVDDDAGRWAGLDQTISAFALLAVVPAAITALVFMIRAWTWSAYDQQLTK